MENREIDRNRKMSATRERQKKRVRRRITLLAGCICLIIVLELVFFFFWGGNKESEIIEDINIGEMLTTESQDSDSESEARLRWLIEDTENLDTSIYTQDTVEVLNQFCKEAKDVLANSDSTQDEVEIAELNLLLAIQGLKNK